MRDTWLRPWGEAGDRYALTFCTQCPAGETITGGALAPAQRLGAIWTVALPEGEGEVLLEAWIPREYRRSMEGLEEASLTVLQGEPVEVDSTAGARRLTVGDLTVNVVRKTRRE